MTNTGREDLLWKYGDNRRRLFENRLHILPMLASSDSAYNTTDNAQIKAMTQAPKDPNIASF